MMNYKKVAGRLEIPVQQLETLLNNFPPLRPRGEKRGWKSLHKAAFTEADLSRIRNHLDLFEGNEVKIKFKAMAKAIAAREGGKVNLSIAQVSEVLKLTMEHLAGHKMSEVVEFVESYQDKAGPLCNNDECAPSVI